MKFWPISLLVNLEQKSGQNFMWANFDKQPKPIALLFDEILANFIACKFGTKSDQNFMWANFDKKPKPIALLFDEILANFIACKFGTKSGQNFMSQFWQKTKAYSLTFWWNFGQFHCL